MSTLEQVATPACELEFKPAATSSPAPPRQPAPLKSSERFSNHTSDRGPLPSPLKSALAVLLDPKFWAALLFAAAMITALVILIQESISPSTAAHAPSAQLP